MSTLTPDEEEAGDALNSAYDMIRGFFCSIHDGAERRKLIDQLKLLHDGAWASLMLGTRSPKDIQTPESLGKPTT